jgi:hypothetical protein
LVLIIQSNVEPLQIILTWLHTRLLSVRTLIETIWHAPANFDEPIMTDPGPHCFFCFSLVCFVGHSFSFSTFVEGYTKCAVNTLDPHHIWSIINYDNNL